MTYAILVYLIMVISNIAGLASAIFVAAMTVATGTAIFWLSCFEDWEKDARAKAGQVLKKVMLVVFIAGPFAMLLPGKTTMHTMLAAYAAENVVTSEAVGRLAPKSIQVVEQYLDNLLEEEE